MELVSQLTPDAKARIKALSGPKPGAFLWAMVSTWVVIAATIGLAVYLKSVPFSILAVCIIATRQNLLALLVHEQTHYLGLNSRFGDMIGNLFAAYPLIAVTIEDYAKVHLRHHRSYFTQDDPDFLRKQGEEWTFPMPLAKLGGLFLRDLTGISFVKFMIEKKKRPLPGPANAFKRKHPTPKWLKPAFFLTLAVVLTLVHGWVPFLLYWMLPLVTVFPAIVRWGAICEHSYGYEGATVEETSPVILPTFLGKLLLPNLHFTMHVYHHLFPGVPFSNLPAVHAIFVEQNLVNQNQLFTGHIDYLRYILKGPEARMPVTGLAAN